MKDLVMIAVFEPRGSGMRQLATVVSLCAQILEGHIRVPSSSSLSDWP